MLGPIICAILRDAKIELAPGLSELEIRRAEAVYDFCFPPDLRELLQMALPTGEQFPDWRTVPNKFISDRMVWPLDGMLFDIKENSFWLLEWGEKPADIEAAYNIARQTVAKAPRLIPIYGHRFLPAEPCDKGNPVFSVYQTDVIYYGSDLLEYFCNEFLAEPFEISGYKTTICQIPLWGRLAAVS